jgi:hypothetical protein
MRLMTEPRIQDPDGFYAELVDSQRGLDDEAAERMNARLILLLANHVGDREALSEALRLARPQPAPG